MPRLRLIAIVLLLASPAAATPETLRLRFPPMTLEPGANIEACWFIRLPLRTAFDVGSYEIDHRGMHGAFAVRHFLVYLYGGDQLKAFGADARRIVQSRGCQDLGPADRDRRQLIASGAVVRNRGVLPAGVALPLTPVPDVPGGSPAGLGILLDAEWVNGDTRAHSGSSLVTFHRIRRKALKRRLAPILARTAERGLLVPPGKIGSTEDSTALRGDHPDAWGPGLATDGAPAPAAACVVSITGHMHKRGVYFTVDHQAADGAIRNPPGSPKDRFDPTRTHLFATPDYTDPGALPFTPAMPLDAGEALRYACRHDNGSSNAVRQGCWEEDGTFPGRAAATPGGGPAKPCRVAGDHSPDCPSSDAAYPGRTFTGKCAEANLVAGSTPDDEVCALAGFYYDAAPGGGCDVSGLLPLRGTR